MLNIRNVITRIKIIKLLSLITLICVSISACGNVKDSQTLIAEAKQYQIDGNDNAAIIQLKNALQQDPNNREARFLIGTIYNKIGDPRSAEKELTRALDLGMDAEKVLPILAESLLNIGEFQQLLDKTNQLSDADSSSRISILRGNALLALGKGEEAKVLFEKILSNEPDDPDALIGLARYSLSNNDLELATRLAVQAVRKNPTNTNAWLFMADLLRAQGKIDNALAAYNQIIKLEPDNVTAHINRATIKINTREFDAAKSSLDAARRISPDNLMVVYTQALLDFNQEKYTNAQESIQKILSTAPEHMPSVLLAGAIQFSLGSLTQAEQHLTKYLERVPNNLYARKLMAAVLLRSQQTQRAIDVLTPALNVVEQDPQLFALAGEAYIKAGDFTKASEYLEKANTLAPDNATLHTALGISMLAQGDSLHAIAELEKATSLDASSPRAGIILVMTHLRLKEYDKALQAVEALEKEQPDNPLFHNLKGGVYLGKEDIAKARASFNKALSFQSDYLPAITNLARLDLQDKNPDAAKKRFEAVLKNDAKNIQAMSALANIALSQGETETATKWFELASSRNPDDLQPAIQLAAYYLRSGEKKKPLALAQKLLRTHSNEPSVLEILAQAQLANDNKSAALDSYERLAARLPESAPAQFQIASVHASMQNLPAASAALKKALDLKPDYLDAQVAQVRLALQNKDENEAIAISRKIQKQHDKLPIGFVLEGDLLMGQNKPALALKAYEQAFSIIQNGQLMVKLYAALSQSGNEKEATSRINKWLKDNPNDAITRMYHASVYLEKQQYDTAIKEYETILQQHPEHTLTLNNLAWLYQQKKDPRALEYAEKAYKQAPEAPAILDTLGWILVEQGDAARAMPLLQRAVSQAPEAAVIRYHFAVALAKTGDKTRAHKELKQLLASGITFPQIEEARNLLNQLQ